MKLRSVCLCLLGLAGSAGMAGADQPSKVLIDGFDGPDFAESGGLYYRDNFEQTAGKVEFQSEVKRTGTGALKLSIRRLCKESDDGCSERAEIWEKTELRVPYDQGVWYGFAVKLAEPVPQDDHRYLIAQWKREIDPGAEGDFSPFLALRLRQGKLFATVETNYLRPNDGLKLPDGKGCKPGSVPVWLRPDTNQMRAVVATQSSWDPAKDGELYDSCTDAISVTDHGTPLPAPESGWIDFVVYSLPGADGSGHLELYANGKPVITVKGHVGHNDKGLGKNQYFKFGPYRAAHDDDWAVYYDDFRRSPNCSDVLVGSPCPTQ